MYHKELQQLLDTKSCICHFECNDAVSESLLETLSKFSKSIGVIRRDDGMYSKFKVKYYLEFFAKLTRNEHLMKEALMHMHLHDLLHVRIQKLTYSQRRRVEIAREIIKDHSILFIQEPLWNLDDDSIRIVITWMEKLKNFQKSVFVTSISLKHLLLLPGQNYYVSSDEFYAIEQGQETEEKLQSDTLAPDKIAVHYEGSIMLFHPHEIDYFESMQSKIYLNVRQNSFLCPYTLDELELRLKRYGFYRSHRSYLVNMQKVSQIVKWTRNSYSLKLEHREDVNIPLSKGRIEEMKELYHF